MFNKARRLGTILLPSVRVYIVASVIVLLTFLTVTFWTWRNALQSTQNDLQTTLDNGTRSASEQLQATVATYGEVLRSSSGLFTIDPNISEDSWRLFIKNLHFEQRYPGMQAISFIQTVPANQIGDFLANNRQANGQPYTLNPEDSRDTYNITRFIEPNGPAQSALIGYDPETEPVRAKAMQTARDTGLLAISDRVTRLTDKQPGFILYAAIYRTGAPVSTPTERRAALLGYVSAGVRISDLVDGLFGKLLNENVALQLFSSPQPTDQERVYQSSAYPKLVQQRGITRSESTFSLSGNEWLLVALANAQITAGSQRDLPKTILVGGIILSLVASALIFTIMYTRARSLTTEKNREVQQVKDNLIALASHQLRTPATGVKQFVGMVLEGYAGNITPEQKSMLQKAYASNERQINIINQILHVSRADSGRLVLTMQRINLSKIVKAIKSEQASVIKERKQRLIIRLPKNDVFMHGDEQYLGMAIDNLLSNASKYSHPKTTITLNLQHNSRDVIITVSDHGVGIAESDMHLLFHKFSRIHNELSIAAGGNGIGLYLCREIVELHGGSIDVASSPGEGSVFTVTLPRKPTL